MTSANVSNVPITPAQTVRGKKSNAKSSEESLEFYQMMQSSMTKEMSQMGAANTANTANTQDPALSVSGGDSFAVSAPAKSETVQTKKQDAPTDGGKVSDKSQTGLKTTKDEKAAQPAEESNAKAELSEEEVAEVSEAIATFTEGIKVLFEETFEISEEDLTSAMEEMGLTFSDLLVPNNAAELAASVLGEEDNSAILIMDGGKEFLDGLTTLTNELAAAVPEGLTPVDIKSVETGISVEELLDAGMELTEQPEVMPEINPEADPSVIINKKPEAPVEQSEEVAVARDPLAREAISMTSEKEDSEEPVIAVEEEPVLSAEEAPVTKSETGPKENNQQQNQSNMGEHRSTAMETHTENAVADNATPQIQPQQENTEAVTQVRSYTNIDTRDVIEQVVTAARTQLTDNVRSIELELNPHNLGKMIMQVTEREGELSARLVAENQSVKEALESQLANLRDRLNEQGVKVTSVEVSVATHEFEQNLEEGQMNGQTWNNESGQESSEGTSSERRAMRGGINLGNPDDLVDLTEAEALEASMMADAGNSVSFRA